MESSVVYSDRKSIAIEINRELRVLVRAPKRATKKQIADFVEKNRDWIDKHLEIQKSRRDAHPMPTSSDEIKALRARAVAYLPERVEQIARIMGADYSGVKITSAKKRFGSCSGKNSLCFSLYLMDYPPSAIDYVIVHELAHTVFHDHSKSFWRLVEKYLPDYRERLALLK